MLLMMEGKYVECSISYNYIPYGNLFFKSSSNIYKNLVVKNRPYREDLRIVADWEQMFYEIVIKDRSYQRLNMKICEFEYGGVSSSKPELRELERKKYLMNIFQKGCRMI